VRASETLVHQANLRDILTYWVRLKEVEQVVNIRGRGFLLGLEFANPAKPIHEALLAKKIITGTSSDAKVLRLLPPLTLNKSEVDVFVDALAEVTRT